MLGPLNINQAEFGVSCRHGFLPDELPLQRLSDAYYSSWEVVMGQLPSLLKTKCLRSHVDSLPVLSTSRLVSEREWQRAYVLLSFMTHGYIWENGGPSERLPAAISVPFLAVSSHVGLPPTATYAAFNLWNFTTRSPNIDLCDLDNLESLHTFTGTKDEAWFYLVSVAIEARGAAIMPVMLKAMDAVRTDDSRVVSEALNYLALSIREIGVILQRMDEWCSPDTFYSEIRPFLAGSKNMSVAGLPNGVFYDEGEGRGQWRQYSGGSNAQSSLIQFFDIVLGVEHPSGGNAKGAKPGFLKEMRNYMPGSHRNFLQHLELVANIREYAETTSNHAVTEAYNFAVNELGLFRNIHIQIVTRYIINPSRRHSPSGNAGLNLAVASTNAKSPKELHGTGGTQLLPFLKQSRDDTNNSALPK